jgi:L-alanine-DL-glutamate epimerase-like enolase superfamily enzyme
VTDCPPLCDPAGNGMIAARREGAPMKITAVDVRVRTEPVIDQFVWRRGLPGSGTSNETIELTIRTDGGVTGVAHGSHGTIVRDIIDRRIRDDLIGRDPLLKEDLWRRIWELDRIEEIPIYGLGPVDVALWDLTAKLAGLPLYRVIGGFRERIPAYASTVTFATTEEFLDVADQCLAAGFRAIKLHA